MKIALAQFNPTVGDFAGNTARILSLAAQAQERGAGLAVFTELCLCGYPPQDLLERPAFIERNHKELKKLAAKIPLPAVIGYAGRVKNGTGEVHRQQSGADLRRTRGLRAKQNAAADLRCFRRIALLSAGRPAICLWLARRTTRNHDLRRRLERPE